MPLIVALRSWSDIGLAIGFIPVLQPLPERHIGFEFYRRVRCDGTFQGLQFFYALALCFCQHIFCLGKALLVIPDDNSAFPSAVLSQADGTFAIFPLSSRGFNSSPKMSTRNSSTISAALFCISACCMRIGIQSECGSCVSQDTRQGLNIHP